jgi:hypothetical protein
MRKSIILFVLIGIVSIYGQDVNSYIELLRSDIKTEKKAIITEVMQFTDKEASDFWTIYREYELELDKNGDKRVGFIKDFAENYMNMTDEKADQIMENAFDFREERLELKKDLYNDLKDKIGSAKSAKFIQVEHQIQLLIDLQINSELPLLEKTAEEEKVE